MIYHFTTLYTQQTNVNAELKLWNKTFLNWIHTSGWMVESKEFKGWVVCVHLCIILNVKVKEIEKEWQFKKKILRW